MMQNSGRFTYQSWKRHLKYKEDLASTPHLIQVSPS